MRRLLLGFGALVLVGLAAGAGVGVGAAGWPGRGEWREVEWPFPRDAWPAGRAFHCGGAGCGGEQDVYVRVKVGFCNCATGVSGDAEVDGVSDLDMIGVDYRPLAPGDVVEIGGMRGRVRGYDLVTPDGRVHRAAGFALSAGCDLVAVASVGPAAGTEAARRGVAGLMGGGVLGWVRGRLGRG